MARILIGNVKPVKGVDYFTQEDIEKIGKSFATKESVDAVATSLEETQEEVAGMPVKFAPAYTYGTDDIEAGSASTAATGTLHFVYE
jgi:hypothetical protein